MSRLKTRFAELAQAGDGALVVFAVAGHPTQADSAAALQEIAAAGADVIEIGIPFSDPLADGPTIQAASQQALENGMTTAQVLDLVTSFRLTQQTPIVLMTCYNPILQFGVGRFATASAAAGVDGVIVTDLPPEESEEWVGAARGAGLDTVFLLAPSSSAQRIRTVARVATGFVYCVSRMGVTGTRRELPTDLPDLVHRIREETSQPIAVGFGISQPEHVAQVCRIAEGAVVGSAVVAQLGDVARRSGVGDFVRGLKDATRGVGPRQPK